ncbi:MAG: aromatic ring-hydroxylating dioxygenase subunit alpha [Reyranella sp.]|uniref:aromatic ring-hydroxylating oxygenase subunit alpha n=1 Tax=Reyranella sp. TaxID=1929291 RepID=UPI003D128873
MSTASGSMNQDHPPACDGTMPADWTRAIVEPAAFAEEQRRLAHVWTFLGMTTDLRKDGDWFRSSIATRSVFVQRFGAELRGFENLCAHRFYPLRNAERGNGPVICGFHHWQYDREGRAVGVPQSRELYDAVPHELGARLTPIELSTCGQMVFGRFKSLGISQSLEDFLDVGFPVLAAGSQARNPQYLAIPVEANWRLGAHISLDDYHSPAVHPRTFGKDGYLRRRDIGYHRFGLHSAFINSKNVDALEHLAEACRNGTYRPRRYSILQFVPNLLMAFFRTDFDFFHCSVMLYEPVSHDRTILRAWFYPAPFPPRPTWVRAVSDLVRAPLVRHYIKTVMREDALVCERIQKGAGQISRPPLLGRLEERIGWFEESYRELMKAGERSANQE